MAKETLNNGELLSSFRGKLNSMFTEIYSSILALGDSSTRNVGTASGTVAAGDDSRIVGAVQTRPIVALTSTIDQTITRSFCNGKTVQITISTTGGTDRVITIGDVGTWLAGETIEFEIVATSGGGVKFFGSGVNTLTPLVNNRLSQLGQRLVLRRNAANTAFVVQQAFPIFAPTNGTYGLIYGDGPVKLAVISSATDFVLNNGSLYVQHSNIGTGGTQATLGLYAEGTLDVANVTGTYATGSSVETFSRQVSYSSEWVIRLGNAVVPHYNTAGAFPGLPTGVVGKRHAAIRLNGTRYTDSKHWGGIAIGAQSGALYNGSWAFFSEYGGFYTQRAGGTISEQRDTATTGTIAATEYTASLSLAGGGTVTVNVPQTPEDGQEWTVFLEAGYTGITLAPGAAGATILAGTVGLTAGSFARWRYRTASNTWRRVG